MRKVRKVVKKERVVGGAAFGISVVRSAISCVGRKERVKMERRSKRFVVVALSVVVATCDCFAYLMQRLRKKDKEVSKNRRG